MTEIVDLGVEGARLIPLTHIVAANGALYVAENGTTLPFPVHRVFTLLDVPGGERRGIHAHRVCQQFLVCMTGSVQALVDDGVHERVVTLDTPGVGLYMPAMTWGSQFDYSADARLTVFASDPYDADDYIHDYEEFRRLKGL
jgi:UDP-2-acetamido-3-amino-2,3-dideoxy-glucuronate N-acetyltransferase